MKLVPFAIDSFARFIVGEPYQHVRNIVEELETTMVSGEEKRLVVIEEIEAIGLSLGGWLLNLAIELAVAALRARA